jgi:hypothetical protein
MLRRVLSWPDPGGVVLALALSCAMGLALVMAEPMLFNEDAGLIAAWLLCGICALGPILLLGRGAAREPVVYYPAIAFADLAGSALLWLGEPTSVVWLSRTDIANALVLVAAGFVAFWLGWYALRGTRPAELRAPLPERYLPSREATIALAVFGVLCILLRIATGSYGYARDFDTGGPLGPWMEWVTAGGVALDIALAFAAIRYFGAADRSRGRPELGVLLVLLVLVFGFGLLAGFKVGETFPKLLVLAFIFAQFRGRLPWKFIAVSIMLLVLAAPVVQKFRELSQQDVIGQRATALLVPAVQATAKDASASFSGAVDTLTGRVRQVENVAVILRDTPSAFPHTGGADIPGAIMAALVPRVVWPGKPIQDAGREFPQVYLGQPATARSALGPTHFGDLYRNFGIAGVLIGMGLLGALFAKLGVWVHRGGLRTLLVIAFAVSVLTRVEAPLGTLVVTLARVMPPVLLAALLLPVFRRDLSCEASAAARRPVSPEAPAPS